MNKPAWLQHQHAKYPQYGAERAVDGNKLYLSISGGQCTVSSGGYSTAEWRVDLGGVLSIHHIFIQYRTDSRVWGMACIEKQIQIICRFLIKHEDIIHVSA